MIHPAGLVFSFDPSLIEVKRCRIALAMLPVLLEDQSGLDSLVVVV